LTHVLVVCMCLVMIGMYVVSAKAGRETFGEDVRASDGDDAANDADDDLDGTIFKAYMDVHGVPPTPVYAKHYVSVARTESLTEAQVRQRILDDKEKASANAPVPPKRAEPSDLPAPPPPDEGDESAESDLRALREKAKSLATMTAPISAGTEHFVTKLRAIAGQASEMLRDLERRRHVPDEPKGIESFIAF
jgi:hypothetical protein